MTHIPITCEVWIDGARVADGDPVPTDAPMALDNLIVHWGRSTSIDQPEPGTASVTLLDRGGGPSRAASLVALGSLLVVWAALAGDRRIVFAGRVTDLDLSYDAGDGGATLDIIAADLLADLANRYVGTEPWPAEALSVRAGRIVTAVAAGAGSVVVDTRPAALPVSRVDVDRQAAATLLRELAVTGSAALWVIVPAGTPATPNLRIEDPSARVSMWILGRGPDNLYRPMPSPTAGDPVDACAILRDPVKWIRSTSDLITRTAVRWLDQSTTPDVTERSVSIVDTAAEAVYGARGLSVGTILSTEAAATAAAQLLMAGHAPSEAWRTQGMVWDVDRTTADTAPTRALLLNLLDNAARIGRAVQVGPLPWWTPNAGSVGLYVDGGTYRFAGGRWVLSLLTTSGIGAGGSLSYAASPRSIRYVDVAPDVSYLDLIGVGPPPAGTIKAVREDAPADARGLGAGVAPLSHNNAYGFPVPDSTDPYCDTPDALAALWAAVNPKLANLPMVFVNNAQYSTDSQGDIIINLSAKFTVISNVMVGDHTPNPAWEPHFYQWVHVGTERQNGIIRIRVLTLRPPDGTVMASNVTQFSMIVTGTPK